MALTINANVASLNAQRHLAETTSLLNKSIERLSSGLRINSASDDAAGLAIADKLRADSRIASQAIRNANDGISALSIGEQALGKSGDIITRLAELASEAASGLISNTQRSGIQSEFTALVSEIDLVATKRGTLGSIESRLNTAIDNLRVASQNFLSAESRIRDADVAEETANLTRNSILQQAGVAVLAQANQQPGLALKLLG